MKIKSIESVRILRKSFLFSYNLELEAESRVRGSPRGKRKAQCSEPELLLLDASLEPDEVDKLRR